jgi:hypothetical protein
VQPFINAAGYDWTFTFFGLEGFALMAAAIPTITFGKWQKIRCAPEYYLFVIENKVE